MKRNEQREGRIRGRLKRLGVQSRIFTYFLLFTAVLLALLWVFQIVFLDDFYRYQKSQALLSSIVTIADNIDNDDLQTLADRISESGAVCVLVLDADLNALVSSDANPGCVIHHMGKLDLARYVAMIDAQDQTVYRVFTMNGVGRNGYNEKHFSGDVPPADNGRVKSMLALRSVSDAKGNVRYLLLNSVITPVNATVTTLRQQYFFIALAMVLLSFLLSLLLSRRIARPIIATNEAAKQLSVGEYTPVASTSYREMEQLNATLAQAAKDLHRVEEMQRELIANISHDLRTPLTLIEGYAEVMRDLPGENTPENMQTIIDETKRLSSLVNAILEYSANKNAAEQLNLTDFDLTQSITEILERYRKLTEQDGYHIRFECDEHVHVQADELKVGQVIYNLINNALTYTGDDKTVCVSQQRHGETIRVEISDSGEGIPQDELKNIWTRYYRGQKPHKRPTVGTGLGLSIVQSVLERHKLAYGVNSQTGIGTTFWFEIPASSGPQVLPKP